LINADRSEYHPINRAVVFVFRAMITMRRKTANGEDSLRDSS